MNLPTHVQRILTLDPFDLFGTDAGRPFGVDVREDADRLIVEAELPGYKKNEVEIVLDKSVLTIAATKAALSASAEGQTQSEVAGEWLLRERRQGNYRRAFHLPRTADGASVSAVLEDGVLTVTLSKREETKPRRIVVS